MRSPLNALQEDPVNGGIAAHTEWSPSLYSSIQIEAQMFLIVSLRVSGSSCCFDTAKIWVCDIMIAVAAVLHSSRCTRGKVDNRLVYIECHKFAEKSKEGMRKATVEFAWHAVSPCIEKVYMSRIVHRQLASCGNCHDRCDSRSRSSTFNFIV